MTKWTIPAEMLAAQAEADALRERVAELEAALELIADQRGICETCGEWADGPGAGIVMCGCENPTWGPQDSQTLAIAALAASREGKACGGCGETDPSKRCIGCFHDFTGREGKA